MCISTTCLRLNFIQFVAKSDRKMKISQLLVYLIVSFTKEHHNMKEEIQKEANASEKTMRERESSGAYWRSHPTDHRSLLKRETVSRDS